MVNVEVLPLSSVSRVTNHPILLAPVDIIVPCHEFSVSTVGKKTLQAIDYRKLPHHKGWHFSFINHIFLHIMRNTISIGFLPLLASFLSTSGLIHDVCIISSIISFVSTGVARWTSSLIGMLFTVQYAVVWTSVYFLYA